MSSLFQYELNERHIKQVLQSKELPYDDSAWQSFDRAMELECPKSKSFIPKNMHLDISTHVITIAAFTIGISITSFILFKNIKFDKTEQVVAQQGLSVIKASTVNTSVAIPDKKASVQTPVTANVNLATTVQHDIVVSEPVATKTNEEKKKEIQPEKEKPTLSNAIVAEPITSSEPPAIEEHVKDDLVASNNDDTPKKKRKKRKSNEAEDLQSITTTSLPMLEEKEPELEIK